MEGMTLKNFKQTMIEFDEIEFTYRGIMHNFQKENATDDKIKISIWQGGDNPKCLYSVEVEDNVIKITEVVEKLINAKIFFNSKSVIDIEFFT